MSEIFRAKFSLAWTLVTRFLNFTHLQNMLRPRYTRRPFELMLIGPFYSGKRTIAAQFLQSHDVYFKINTDNGLPSNHIERTDFILLMLDMTNRGCLNLLQQTLGQIDDVYLLNKLAIVITKVDMPEKWSFEMKDIQDIIQDHPDLQLFYVNLTNLIERKIIVDQITRLIKINTLQFQNVDIEYIKSQEYFPEEFAHPVKEEGSTISYRSNTVE